MILSLIHIYAASLQVLAEKYPEAKVVGNAKTFNMIPQFFTFDLEGRKVVVKEGDTLSLSLIHIF